MGDKCPIRNTGTNIFINIIGRYPFVGEQVTQPTGTSTYLGNGMWDSIPTLDTGRAAFLKIITEPSPLLTIVYAKNQAIISWSPSVLNWTLQTNSNFATGTWWNYAGVVINNTVTNSTPMANLFFRLSYP
jgi:hypothetical protein